MIRLYATVTEYQAYTLDNYTPAATVGVLLRDASRAIDRAAIAAVYPTDPQGYPLDANLLDTFKNATCEQVTFMRELDDRTGAKQRLANVKVGSLTFTRASGTAGLAMLPVAPRALEELRLAGVLPVAPMVNW
ncbi:MAG: hypothetical protein ACRDRN_10335 [Sciscionella sp.]